MSYDEQGMYRTPAPDLPASAVRKEAPFTKGQRVQFIGAGREKGTTAEVIECVFAGEWVVRAVWTPGNDVLWNAADCILWGPGNPEYDRYYAPQDDLAQLRAKLAAAEASRDNFAAQRAESIRRYSDLRADCDSRIAEGRQILDALNAAGQDTGGNLFLAVSQVIGKLATAQAEVREGVSLITRLAAENAEFKRFHDGEGRVSAETLAAERYAALVVADKKIAALQKKSEHSLANNLCPDHRDKQIGKPCLACFLERADEEIATLTRDREALIAALATSPPGDSWVERARALVKQRDVYYEELTDVSHRLSQAVATANRRDEKWKQGIEDDCGRRICFDPIGRDQQQGEHDHPPTLREFVDGLRKEIATLKAANERLRSCLEAVDFCRLSNGVGDVGFREGDWETVYEWKEARDAALAGIPADEGAVSEPASDLKMIAEYLDCPATCKGILDAITDIEFREAAMMPELRRQAQEAWQRLDFHTADRLAKLLGDPLPSAHERDDLEPSKQGA